MWSPSSRPTRAHVGFFGGYVSAICTSGGGPMAAQKRRARNTRGEAAPRRSMKKAPCLIVASQKSGNSQPPRFSNAVHSLRPALTSASTPSVRGGPRWHAGGAAKRSRLRCHRLTGSPSGGWLYPRGGLPPTGLCRSEPHSIRRDLRRASSRGTGLDLQFPKVQLHDAFRRPSMCERGLEAEASYNRLGIGILNRP